MKMAAHKAVASKQEETPTTPSIRVLQVGSALSLSGKATLTYQIGCADGGEIYVRVSANSGGGFWSAEWLSLQAIQSAMESITKGTPITSYALRGLFSGKSVNSRGFLMAVLKHLGLMQPLQKKQRCYEWRDPKPFLAEVKALIDSGVALPAAEASTQVGERKKAAPKSKAKPA